MIDIIITESPLQPCLGVVLVCLGMSILQNSGQNI